MIAIDIPMPMNCTVCKFMRYNKDDFVKPYKCILNDRVSLSGKDRPEGCPVIDLDDDLK